jgi:hypothetical protein
MELGQTAFGKAAQDISGTEASGRVGGAGMIGGSAIKVLLLEQLLCQV